MHLRSSAALLKSVIKGMLSFLHSPTLLSVRYVQPLYSTKSWTLVTSVYLKLSHIFSQSAVLLSSRKRSKKIKKNTAKGGLRREEKKANMKTISGTSSEVSLLYTNSYFFRLVIRLQRFQHLYVGGAFMCAPVVCVTFLTFLWLETFIVYRKKLLFLISLVVVL